MSQNDCNGAKLISLTLIRRNSITNDALASSSHCHAPFFLSFNVFGRVHNRSSEIIVCCRLLTCDTGLESVKFHRLQLPLRLQPKRSTPTDSNSGLDSASAALPITLFLSTSILGTLEHLHGLSIAASDLNSYPSHSPI